ncbi:hypothetical protein WJX72_006169 [[Myrmecia] bisecta]|uniref:Uncharacterized protein n=1 Tax=[Myrmecia] bisecta TaxID=41462 RepID=A0AAW1QR44_9CHLO
MQAAVADWQSAGSIEAEVEKLHTALTVIQQQVRASLQQEAQPQICEAAEKCELLGQELVHLQQANAKVVDNLRGSQNRTAQLEQLITTCSTKRKSLLTAEIAAEEKLQSHYARQLREQHERMQDLESMDAHHGADHAPGFADTGETSAAANEGEHQQEDAALGNGNADGESEAFEQLLERLPADLRQPFSELDAEMAGLGLRPNTPPIPKASRSTASSPQKGGHDHAPSSHPEPEKLGGTGQLTSQLDFHERRINALEVEKADLEQLLKRTWAMQKEKEEWPHDSQGPPWSSGRSQTSRDASPSGSAANHKPPDSARADSSERKRFKRWSSPSSSGPSVQALQGKVNTLSQRLASTEAHKREAEEQLVQTRERLLAAEHATAQYKAWLVKAAKKLGYLESANLPVSPPHSPRRSTEDFANTLRNAQGAASASSSGQRRASWLDLPNGASAAALRAQRRMSQSVSPARSGRRVSQENANGSLEASPPLSMPRRRTNSMLLRDGTPPKRAGSTTSQALPAAANRLGRRPSISPQRTPDGSPGGPLQRTGSASPPRPPGQRWWRAKDDQAKHETVHLRSSNAERNGGAAREPAADDYKMDGGGAHFAVAQSQAAARKKGSGNLQA